MGSIIMVHVSYQIHSDFTKQCFYQLYITGIKISSCSRFFNGHNLQNIIYLQLACSEMILPNFICFSIFVSISSFYMIDCSHHNMTQLVFIIFKNITVLFLTILSKLKNSIKSRFLTVVLELFTPVRTTCQLVRRNMFSLWN